MLASTIERDQHIDSWIPLNSNKKGGDVSGELKLSLDVEYEGGQREKIKKKKEAIAIVEEDIPAEDEEVLFAGQRLKIQEVRKASGVTRLKRTK